MNPSAHVVALWVMLGAAAQALAGSVTVITPAGGERAYQIAGKTFADLWTQVTGNRPALLACDGAVRRNPPAGDLILIGSDAVHPLVHDLIRNGKVSSLGIAYGTDAYRILSVPEAGRTLLIVAGGCGRSTIYGVYDFFRRQAGAEYFWDGDRIPRRTSIELSGVDVLERPRFEYRGLRYFAHRGLHRFQAEHWDLDDWKREIDWLLKKRFNLFMLRIGIDDLFQRAFPGKVDYPPEDGPDPDAVDRSYNDRTSFWPLRYRGELRKQVLRYALDRGLLHPEDAGTITHWYSHTPSSFYRNHPDFPLLRDQTSGYDLPTAAIWDVEEERTWDAYWRLTETHIREYGATPRLFHTIGLAERRFGASEREDTQRKLYVYRKTQQLIREHYPDVPLLIASWDFWGWWRNEAVRALLDEFDPRRTIIHEYTADAGARTTYRDWGIYGRFPWIFGIFHGFAANSDAHEDYSLLGQRLADAANDHYCLGLVLWSEISHNDTLMLEYLAANSWRPEALDPVRLSAEYSRRRYAPDVAIAMQRLWSAFLPISQLNHWGHDWPRSLTFGDPQFRLTTSAAFLNLNEKWASGASAELKRFHEGLRHAPELLEGLAGLVPAAYYDEFWRRDALDMARTTANRALLSALLAGALEARRGSAGQADESGVQAWAVRSEQLMQALAEVLAASDDFSMYASLQRLRRAVEIGGIKPKVNAHSERTLKSNAENNYCRSHHYELVRHLYLPELRTYWEFVRKKVRSGDRPPWPRSELAALAAGHRDRFYETPLSEMAPRQPRGPEPLARTLRLLAGLTAELLRALPPPAL